MLMFFMILILILALGLTSIGPATAEGVYS